MPRFPGMSVVPAFSAQGTGEPVPVFVRLFSARDRAPSAAASAAFAAASIRAAHTPSAEGATHRRRIR
jgi:hypothetical protein